MKLLDTYKHVLLFLYLYYTQTHLFITAFTQGTYNNTAEQPGTTGGSKKKYHTNTYESIQRSSNLSCHVRVFHFDLPTLLIASFRIAAEALFTFVLYISSSFSGCSSLLFF